MDFTNKNNELNLVKRTAKIFLQNSILMKITGGKAELSLDNNTHAEICLGVGDILYIEKGTSLSFKHMKHHLDDCVKVIELEECLLKSILPIISHLSCDRLTESPVNVKKHFIAKERRYVAQIFDEINGAKISKSDARYKELVHSIYYILSFFTCLSGFLASIERSMKNCYSEKIYKMMMSDINKKWTLRICAYALHTSVSTLKRKLDAEGNSFRKIYLEVRMNVSLNLLRTTTKSIATVASESGFNSCSNFSTAFSRYYGITPKKVSKNMLMST